MPWKHFLCRDDVITLITILSQIFRPTGASVSGKYPVNELEGKHSLSSKIILWRKDSHQFDDMSNYRPQRSCGQGNIFTGVCLFTGGEGVCLSAWWDAIPPQMENPPNGEPPRMENPPRWRTPPLDGEPPRWRTLPLGSRLQHTVYERPVRILLECMLVLSVYWFDL